MSLQTATEYRLSRHDTWNMRPPPHVNEEKGEFRVSAFNIQTAWVTDSPNNLEKYPKYAWEKRLKPTTQLILRDRPTVLALSELHLKQCHDLKKSLNEEGYQLVGHSSETHESIETVEKKVNENDNYYYSEFVGFLFDSKKVVLKSTKTVELEKGERHKRILVIGEFLYLASKVDFVVLTTHFDHLSLQSRKRSGEQELEIIQQLEEKRIPWLSIGDRNWFSDREGQQCAEQYIKQSYICDFRDENEEGHYGPSGTYPGHLGLAKQFEPVITQKQDKYIIEAETLDVGFRSQSLLVGVNDFCYSGEFSEIGDLLDTDKQGDVSQKNFVSDHYYVGGTFRFKI